jgi:hypothetical protein
VGIAIKRCVLLCCATIYVSSPALEKEARMLRCCAMRMEVLWVFFENGVVQFGSSWVVAWCWHDDFVGHLGVAVIGAE